MDNVDKGVAGADVSYVITLLSVSWFQEDHIAMGRIFGEPQSILYTIAAEIASLFRSIRHTSAVGGTKIPGL